jgi:hypothetical protein
MPCTESGACSPRKLNSQQGSSKPCRVAQVPECEGGYDWPSPCSHSRQCYSRHVFVSSSALSQVAEGGLGSGWLIGQDKLGFKKLRLPQLHNFRNTSIFDTCLNAFEFQVGFYMLCFSPLSRCTRPLVHSLDSANAGEEYEAVHHEQFIITHIALAREDNIMHL